MNLIPLPIKDAYLIEFRKFHDDRGYLQEVYNDSKLPEELRKFFPAKQNTLAKSKKNVLRGLHMSPYCKLMTCVKGHIYDVIADLRPDSPTFMRWIGVDLSDDNCRQLFVPPYCAHGYFVYENDTTVFYVQGGCYDPPNERGITPFDAILNVHWPVSEGIPAVLSTKDQEAPPFAEIANLERPPHRALILGGTGQVGGAIIEAMDKDKYIYYGTYNEHPQELMTPFYFERAAKDKEYCDYIMNLCHPHVVFICTAFTWVDGNERFPEKAEDINYTAAVNITESANKIKAKVIYFSSDYVFSGANNQGLLEEGSTLDPVNKYGDLKVKAENAIRKLQSEAIIIRTSRVYGPEVQGKNFVYQLAKASKEGRNIACLTEEVSCATYNRDLARAALGLLQKGACGVFHCCGPQPMSKHEWGLHTLKCLNLEASVAEPISWNNNEVQKGTAKRPTHVPMDTTKLRKTLPDFTFHTIKDALKDWRKNPRGKTLLF